MNYYMTVESVLYMLYCLLHPVLGGIQRGLPSRKHMAKVNEKPGMVSSGPAKWAW